MIRKFLSVMLVLLLSFGVATSASAAQKEGDRAREEFLQELARLQPYLTLDNDGFFQVTAKSAKEIGVSGRTLGAVKAQFAEINGELAKMSAEERHNMFKSDPGSQLDQNHVNTCRWVYVPKWALQAFAWMVIILGGVSATLALFADATIVGLPAGAVLGALGIWLGITGSAFLWWVDNNYRSRWVFTCW